MEPMHFFPTECRDRDMSSIKRRLEVERSVSCLINEISPEQGRGRVAHEMMSSYLNNFELYLFFQTKCKFYTFALLQSFHFGNIWGCQLLFE
jgi:hypothetical protein